MHSPTDSMALENQVVVVTGAGRGLGRALSEAFVNQGCRVAGLGRTLENLMQVQDALGESFKPIEADVAEYQSVVQAFSSVLEEFGRIDILFNNAAVYPKLNFLEESADAWMQAMAINLGGVANCCKAVLPYMIKAKYGRIYNVGSWADLAPIENSSAYSASKGGLHALTKSIAVDIQHAGLDIGVHEWIPGHLNTRMSDFTGIAPEISADWAVDIVKRPSSSSNCLYENDHEWVPPKGIRSRIREFLRHNVK